MSKLSTRLKLLLCLISAGVCLPAYSAQPTDRELQITAAYLFNFTKFIRWNEVTTSQSEIFTFCIVNDDYFTKTLKTVVNNRTVVNKKTKIRNVSETDQVADCNLLYIPQHTPSLNSFYINKVSKLQSLTVGNTITFNQLGGMIRFYTKNNKLKFEINNLKVLDAGIKIDSQLLRLGKRSDDD